MLEKFFSFIQQPHHKLKMRERKGMVHLTEHYIVQGDGEKLHLRVWLPPQPQPIKGVIMALHGYNDYSKAFEVVGKHYAELGYAFYAYDQRGFGKNENCGIWPGAETLVLDCLSFAFALKSMYVNLPLYAFGESMGGAIVLNAATLPATHTPFNGLVLLAPGLWSKHNMPTAMNASLWLMSHTVPWLEVSPKFINRKATNNLTALSDLKNDPYVMKSSRIDTLNGVVELMNEAESRLSQLTTPSFILYGEKEDILPLPKMLDLLKKLPELEDTPHRIALYPNAHHMLLRDLHCAPIIRDIDAWLEDPKSALPSQCEYHLR